MCHVVYIYIYMYVANMMGMDRFWLVHKIEMMNIYCVNEWDYVYAIA